MMGGNKLGGAGGAAPALLSAGVVTPTASSYPQSYGAATGGAGGAQSQPRQRRHRGEPAIAAKGPLGRFVVTGQTARALVALVKAGKGGVTALEVNSWAYRLGAYVHRLRHENGLAIETVREKHDGGWHGRYVLRCTVVLVGAGQ